MSKVLINRTLASSFSDVFSALPVITLTEPRQAADEDAQTLFLRHRTGRFPVRHH